MGEPLSPVAELIAAVKARDVNQVRELLDQAPELANARAETGDSLALVAAYCCAAEVAELLLERGAVLNVFEAAALGTTIRLQALLDADPNLVHTYSHDGWTPLHLAAHFGHSETVRALLRSGADIHARSLQLKNTALHAAIAGRCPEAAAILMAAGADVNARDASSWTPLHLAAANGMLDTATLLLQNGAQASGGDSHTTPPLSLAIKGGHRDVIDLLLMSNLME